MTALAFSGLRSGRGPLTQGQRIVLESLSRRSADADYTYNLDRVVPVQPGADLPDVTDAVRALVCRHDALHTRFVTGPEQVVDAGGDLMVTVHDSVEEARAAVGAAPFDVSAEWGVRVAVVCRRERPRCVVLGLSHLAADAWAAGLVADDLRGLLRAQNRPATARQPLEQAAAERTPDAAAAHTAAIAYLRAVLLAAPAAQDVAVDPDGWHLGELRSGTVDRSARATATRLRTTPAVVYLAATVTALGDRQVVKTIAHNRQTAEELTCVAPFALDLFVPVDPAGSFDEVVARTWVAYRDAARHSRYDPAAVPDLVAGVTAERGSIPDLSVLVNDLRPSRPGPVPPGPATFRWGVPFRLPGLTRYLAIAEEPALSLLANESALSRSDVPVVLHELAELMS